MVIGLVLLIAVGPEQLPGVIRRVGSMVAQARSMTEGLRSEFMAGLEEIERVTDPDEWTTENRPFERTNSYAERKHRLDEEAEAAADGAGESGDEAEGVTESDGAVEGVTESDGAVEGVTESDGAVEGAGGSDEAPAAADRTERGNGGPVGGPTIDGGRAPGDEPAEPEHDGRPETGAAASDHDSDGASDGDRAATPSTAAVETSADDDSASDGAGAGHGETVESGADSARPLVEGDA